MVKRGKWDNWIGHIFRRSCVIKHAIEGRVMGRRGRDRSGYWITLRKRRDTGK
jgi:hypothetical protein